MDRTFRPRTGGGWAFGTVENRNNERMASFEGLLRVAAVCGTAEDRKEVAASAPQKELARRPLSGVLEPGTVG